MINWIKRSKATANIFEAIGMTPLTRLNTIPREEGIEANIYGKLEWFSPTGSLKDRIYYRMITEAIKCGDLKPGMEIIETSTGNAGIACSFVGKMYGYKVTIVMPEGMSDERKKLMRMYGADIVFTPGAESDVDLCLELTKKMKAENPGRYWEVGQYDNPNNIKAHYEGTGPEIWEQTEGKIDAFVATQGTGGTLTGVGKFLRERNPEVKLYAVEPTEAPMLSKREWGSHRIEGIGDGFVPRNLDLSILAGIITTTSDEAIEMGKKLSTTEGIFCGISSGSNVAACIKLAKKHPEMKHIVTMINDTGQRYFSTELCGEEKVLDIPEREHPMDDYTIAELDKYQDGWEIVG
ncbi:cysteine synthase family protein [bacterium]|nr:cysteine synthase family protein [bacterium]